jgi:glycosyltransferase involved in cell wall biosynthesis
LLGLAPLLSLRIGWLTAKRQLLKIVDDFQPDVVLANHSLVSGFVALQLNQLRDLPYITVDHEVGDFLGCHDNPRWLKLLRPVIRSAACSVTVSRTMQRIAEQVIPEGRFQTIYNGAGFEPCDLRALDRHVEKPDVRIFCCGNLYGRKDVPLLIQAFDQVSKIFPQATLRIAGDGPDRELIEKLISTLASKSQIFLMGSIEHQKVQEEMLAADVFALVGWAEPFGVVFLEAMANGCPVVVSSDAGVAEILTDGETAVLTKPRDLDSVVKALTTLCRCAKKRDTIARAGHALYKESCQWKHRAIEYANVLERAIEAGPT